MLFFCFKRDVFCYYHFHSGTLKYCFVASHCFANIISSKFSVTQEDIVFFEVWTEISSACILNSILHILSEALLEQSMPLFFESQLEVYKSHKVLIASRQHVKVWSPFHFIASLVKLFTETHFFKQIFLNESVKS